MLKIKCPKCGTALNVPDDQVQGKGRCTSCGVKFLIPANEEDEIEIIEELEDGAEKNGGKNSSVEDKGDNESKDKDEPENKDESDIDQLSDDFMSRWLKILGLISLGLIIGILIGFYFGRFTATPDDDFYQSGPSIKSRGDTIDPFGINNN